MKKYFNYLIALTALVMFTSCLSDSDEPERKLSFTTPINCQAINGDDVVFTLGTSKVDMDFAQSLINFTFDYKDAEGKSHTLVTPQMKLTAVNSTAYQFTAAGQGNGGAESLSGYLDMPNLILWYTFNDGSTKMVCTSQLLYAYTNTTITNPDNGNNGNHQMSAYSFALDDNGQTGVLTIYNFISNLSAAIDVSKVEFEGLTVTQTATGYTITSNEVASKYNGYYTLTDVNFNLTNQGKTINGSFKCKGLEFAVTGDMFNMAQSN